MIVFALCADRPAASGDRDALFEAHSTHVVGVVHRLLLAAPIAPVDGLPPLATAELTGSIFAIEAQNLAEAAALMRDDPYTGTVWANVELLAASAVSGRWTGPAHVPAGGIVSGDGRYLLLAREPCAHGVTGSDALLAADVTPAGMVVGEQRSGCCGIFIVEVPDLPAAAERGRALFGGPEVVRAMAIPVGLGRWPGYPEIAAA